MPKTKLPVNFNAFINQKSINKEELSALLTDSVSASDYPIGRDYISSGKFVVSKSSSEPMPATDHEEADTRMCLHVIDAVQKGANTIKVCTVDTDVVVILVGIFFKVTN